MKHYVGKVLIVEDDVLIRDLLTVCARRYGYQVVEAMDGKKALDVLHNHRDIDLVLTDVWMPGLSGVDLLNTLQRDLPYLPVALISGQATLQSSLDALNNGAYAYLVKPFQPEQIRDVLARGLQKSHEARKFMQLESQLDSSRQQVDTLQSFVGDLKQEIQDFSINNSQRMNEGMSELILGLRHELGNLATAILLNLSDMSVRVADNKQEVGIRDNLLDLQTSADDLAQLVNRLMEFPRKEETIEEFDLRRTARHAVRWVNQQYPKVAITLDMPETKLHVWGDYAQITRAVLHIVENACKFAAEDDPRVQIAIQPITTQAGHRAEFTVTDNGNGFAKGSLDAAFSPGYTTRITEGFVRGLGMGLFIARATIELYGGQIKAGNQSGGGARVSIELPLAG